MDNRLRLNCMIEALNCELDQIKIKQPSEIKINSILEKAAHARKIEAYIMKIYDEYTLQLELENNRNG